jgi:hypothetical protein
MIVARKNAIMLAVVLCMIPAALCVKFSNAWQKMRHVTLCACAAMDLRSTKLQNGTSSGFST